MDQFKDWRSKRLAHYQYQHLASRVRDGGLCGLPDTRSFARGGVPTDIYRVAMNLPCRDWNSLAALLYYPHGI